MKFKLLAVLLIFNFTGRIYAQLPAYPVEEFSADTAFQVHRIVDGDTVVIVYNGKPTPVRLIGVDTPEIVHPQKPVEAFGKEASAFTQNLLSGESVYLRFDQEKTDKYGRLLAYLYRAPDGLFVNLEIVRQGYGHAYTQYPFKHMELFRHYERQARGASKGLWNKQTSTKQPSKGPSTIQPKSTNKATDTVFATRTGSKYHRSGCRFLSKSQIPYSLEEAKRRYSPCKVCKPPE